MTADRLRTHLRAFTDEHADDLDDPRVAAVLAVLAGAPVDEIATEYAVDPSLLHRWVRAFLEAGVAQVTNRPTDVQADHRDRFLGAYAHEMRSPLAAAQGWTEMLRDETVTGDAIPRVLDRLGAALERLSDRSRDVELLSASSLGRLRVQPAPVTVADVVAGVKLPEMDAVRPEANRIGGDGDQVQVLADLRYFPIVVRDLWIAAYTPPRPIRVRLDTARVDSWTELRVVRVAEPVEPAVLQALFDPFGVNDDGTGVTIGLYLARALTVAHGGTIGVDQDETGAVLWVRLPAPSSVTDTA